VFTKQDSLRAVLLKKERGGTYYHLDVKVNPKDSTITGSNTIKYQVVQEYNACKSICRILWKFKVIQDGVELKYNREGMFLLN
jgi:hypothetical protein